MFPSCGGHKDLLQGYPFNCFQDISLKSTNVSLMALNENL